MLAVAEHLERVPYDGPSADTHGGSRLLWRNLICSNLQTISFVLMIAILSVLPDAIRRRGSLSNIFRTVRSKWHLDRSSSSEDSSLSLFSRGRRNSRPSGEDAVSDDLLHGTIAMKPPRLEILSEVPICASKDSTTFEESFDRAARKITLDYGDMDGKTCPELVAKPTDDTNGQPLYTKSQLRLSL